MKTSILPYPKKYEITCGSFDLSGCDICVIDDLDSRIIKAAMKLRNALTEKTGTFHKFMRTATPLNRSITILKDIALSAEEYAICVEQDFVKIVGGDDAGCFYGIGTFLQILEESDGKSLSAVSVKDKPDMKHRGYYYDVTRGRVPTVEGLKKIIDLLAKIKVNSLQIYVEHTFEFKEFESSNFAKENFLTAEEILEIDEYCYENFIDFIPSIATFGHLYELLVKDEYKHLCELEDFKPDHHFWQERMSHHTIDPTNPESFLLISSLIDQYLPLFRSNYFNICCDETFDLCKGKNKDKESSKLYIDFVSKITKHITDAGKTVMMWADIALEHPEMLSQIPDDTIMLNWWYDANPDPERFKKVKQQEKTQIVCPGTNSWRSLIELISISKQNIQRMAELGYQNNAICPWGS